MYSLQIYKNYNELSAAAAQEMIAVIKPPKPVLICLATGDTPKLAYKLLCEKIIQENISLAHCTFIGLDEWIGIAPENKGSCHYFLHQHIFSPLNIPASKIHLFNAFADDLEKECRAMDKLIGLHGGIDLIVAGVGMNGHIGFNEPGTSAEAKSHVVQLSDITTSVGQKYFEKKESLRLGITIGLAQVLFAKTILLMANGVHKATIMKEVLDGEISEKVPASLVRRADNAILFLDEAAAS